VIETKLEVFTVGNIQIEVYGLWRCVLLW